MDEIWQVILGSAVVSTLITNVCVYFQRESDYKRDYYKKIIDKRIAAYEKLSSLLVEITVTSGIMEEGGIEVGSTYKIFKDSDSAILINKKIIDVASDLYYYSPEVGAILKEINSKSIEYLKQVERDCKDEINYERDCLSWGSIFSNELQEMTENIKIEIAKDMLTLYEVENFLKKN